MAAFALTIFAQSPDLMTYQAVLRDAENHLLTNQAVAIQISVIQGTPNGAAIYTEVHSISTNANGLVSLMIGDGVTGDDFSTIDWSNVPYFLKTETDPAGGTNYTITTTSQLLSVPYAKFADEAGNAFSGNYADLIGSPTVVSAFANDEGYLTSELWSQNGSNLYYLGGYIGIGTSTPVRPLTINTGADNNFSAWHNDATGSGGSDGFLVGIQTDLNGFVWNWEYGPLQFGTNNVFRMTISRDGDVGIGTTVPTARLDVRGDTKFGANGVAFNELREVTGTTHASNNFVIITLPSGYNETNTRILSVEINYNSDRWVGLGLQIEGSPSPAFGVSYLLDGTSMYIYYPDQAIFQSKAFRALIMQIAP
ncbi:MAG: hypothetical protein KAI08_15020 [Bacteroidales bacterium]|nr:hypothetical protein [Bacteroidales bacterium]